MENSLIKRDNDIMVVSKNFAESGYFKDATSIAKAYVKIMTGRELGFGAMASMSGISIIQDKPVIGANLMAAKIRPAGYDYQITKNTDTVVEIDFFNSKGRLLGTSSFTMEDARAAGLAGKDNWRKYPRNMLFARAISNGIKWFCPDCLNGVTAYTPDEMGMDEDSDGNAIVYTNEPKSAPTDPKTGMYIQTEPLGKIIDAEMETMPEMPYYLKEPVPDGIDEQQAEREIAAEVFGGEVVEKPVMPSVIDDDEEIRIKIHHLLESRNNGVTPYPNLCKTAQADLMELTAFNDFKGFYTIGKISSKALKTVYGKAKKKYPALVEGDLPF